MIFTAVVSKSGWGAWGRNHKVLKKEAWALTNLPEIPEDVQQRNKELGQVRGEDRLGEEMKRVTKKRMNSLWLMVYGEAEAAGMFHRGSFSLT